MTTLIAQGPVDVNVRFVRVEDGMPRPWLECMIYVDFGDDGPAIFYGAHDGEKWLGAMPWDSCGYGEGTHCVALDEISGTVTAWAPFPKPNVKFRGDPPIGGASPGTES